MEIDDEDEDEDDESSEPLTCIKHVTFTPQHAPNDIFRVNQVCTMQEKLKKNEYKK